jgi:hypothetical protein
VDLILARAQTPSKTSPECLGPSLSRVTDGFSSGRDARCNASEGGQPRLTRAFARLRFICTGLVCAASSFRSPYAVWSCALAVTPRRQEACDVAEWAFVKTRQREEQHGADAAPSALIHPPRADMCQAAATGS